MKYENVYLSMYQMGVGGWGGGGGGRVLGGGAGQGLK